MWQGSLILTSKKAFWNSLAFQIALKAPGPVLSEADVKELMQDKGGGIWKIGLLYLVSEWLAELSNVLDGITSLAVLGNGRGLH